VAVTITWGTRVINVPRADMLLIQSMPTEIRELSIDAFRLELKSLEDSEEGMPFPITHNHNTIVTLGGVTYARLIEIINGYTITFEDGQYAVNLVGANSNIGDVVNVNQVSVRSANSAGLTYSKEIEDQSFLDARVWIDITNGLSGTQFPRGTPSDPVNNHTDAKAIITNRGLADRIHLHGTLTLPSGDDIIHSDWLGSAPTLSAIVVNNGQDFSNATLKNISVSGNPLGDWSLYGGSFKNLTDYGGDAVETAFDGNIILPSGASTRTYTLHKCYSGIPGTSTPIFDCNNASNLDIQFRGYIGGIEIQNYSAADNNMTIDLNSGHAVLSASCTDGTIVVRGSGQLTDNSNGATVVTNGLTLSRDDGILTTKKFIALQK
jgi:hypothetical protein